MPGWIKGVKQRPRLITTLDCTNKIIAWRKRNHIKSNSASVEQMVDWMAVIDAYGRTALHSSLTIRQAQVILKAWEHAPPKLTPAEWLNHGVATEVKTILESRPMFYEQYGVDPVRLIVTLQNLSDCEIISLVIWAQAATRDRGWRKKKPFNVYCTAFKTA